MYLLGHNGEMARRGCSKPVKIIGGILGVVVLGVGIWIGPTVMDFVGAGFFEKVEKRKYSASTMSNLKAIYTAMSLYHESEERFPAANGWMDAIEGRLQAGDMDKSESAKKLISPEFASQPGKFGYAMNEAASEKYKDDVAEPSKTPLVFDSSDSGRNAHGEPEKLYPNPPRDGQNHGVSIDGTALTLPAGTP